MKLFSLILSIVLLQTIANGQANRVCGTHPMDSATFVNQPWYGNNQFLLDLIDSVGYNSAAPKSNIAGGFDPQAVYWVPVKAWVYHDDNGDGGLTQLQVERSIRTMNENFSGITNATGNAQAHILVQFYLNCDITYVNSSQYTLDPSDNEVEDMFEDNHTSGMMNIHYIQDSDDFGGKANRPNENPPFSFTVVGNAHQTSTMAHEAGHAFSMSHTHQGRCWLHSDNGDCSNCHQEPVSRVMIQPVGCGNFSGDKKCEVNGDGLCDTPGDPNISELVEIIDENAGLYNYTGTGQDNWSQTWTPDIFNIMSYSLPQARERFSPMQIGMIYFWVIGNVPPLFFPTSQLLHNQNEFVDIYEPDNFNFQENIAANIHRINFGEPQHRGLHAVKSGLRANPNYTYCDEDYVRFTVPGNTTSKVNIATHAVDGAQQVNTEIFLFEDDGITLLANNDDKGTGDIYSKISELELPPGDYWI